MPKEQSPGKPTARRYSPEEKAAAVRMVRALRAELGTEQGTVSAGGPPARLRRRVGALLGAPGRHRRRVCARGVHRGVRSGSRSSSKRTENSSAPTKS